MNENEKSAHEAWVSHAREHATLSRRDFIAGYDAGAFAERLRLVAFIAENQTVINEYAGEKGFDLLTNLAPTVPQGVSA